MQGKFQEILAQIGMVVSPEASNESTLQSTLLQETTEGYVKTYLELLPDGTAKVIIESGFPLFEESTEEIASRIINAQQSLLTE
jgi:hypothetical protein